MRVRPTKAICHLLLAALAACAAAASGPALRAQSPDEPTPEKTAREARLAGKLAPLIAAHRGKVAVAVESLESGESFRHDADQPMPTASLIKVAVMVEAMRQAREGKLDLEERVTLKAEDKAPGSGVLTPHFSAGAQLTVRDAIRLMMAFSDNTATNLVLDRIGVAAVGEAMESLGLSETKINGRVFRGDEPSPHPERRRQFGLGSTTANETLALLKMIHERKVVDEEACEAMLEHLRSCDNRSMLARDLPSEARLAQKTGAVTAVRTNAGVMQTKSGPVAVCVLTAENADRRWTKENAAEQLCAEIGRLVYEHFQTVDEPAKAQAAPSDAADYVLRTGAQGKVVEMLQRTLNARLAPSPDLSVDGEFGPMTEAAVKRFQASRELPATGEVDARTWQALSPVVTEDPPVAEPSVVNAERMERTPPIDLDGPPDVTCKAWAIADAKTGQILWERSGSRRLDIASTTKVMTAYLVMKAAREKPDALDEMVVFSERADQTPGSTAGVRAGERVSVSELLYGLLLPSGNDASVALAEHFGGRFDVGGDGADPLESFVAEMNRAAEALELKDTRFANPHGLTARDHRSTACDLARLACAALEDERFRDYVQTRQRGASLEGPGGYRRNVLWKNTNQLLSQEGFAGVKTGTTSAAGACLISLGERGDDSLIVVILGSATSDSRYVDARNLFRWAWRQR